MHTSLFNKIRFWLTPNHKKPVDEHILRDQTTRKLIDDTEALLMRMTKKAPKNNKRQSIRRKQKEWIIRVKVTHKYITVVMMDTKFSTSPIRKRFVIRCYRKYMRALNGVGECKEATIRYIKDGRAHIRSIRDSSFFQLIFYRIHHLDLAFSNEKVNIADTAKQLLSTNEVQLQASQHNLPILLEEANRYIKTIEAFNVEPIIYNRLQQIINEVEKLQDDFSLLDFEERHIVRRMIQEDIPSLMHTFLSLSPKHRTEQVENVYTTLSKMELTLMAYVDQLEKLRVERMEFLLKLQSLRYDS